MALPAGDESPRVVQPGKEALDDPSAPVASERAAILRRGLATILFVRRDQFDPEVRLKPGVERVAVVGEVANQARRVRVKEPVLERGVDEPNFMW